MVQEFPDLARTYSVTSVPLTVVEPLEDGGRARGAGDLGTGGPRERTLFLVGGGRGGRRIANPNREHGIVNGHRPRYPGVGLAASDRRRALRILSGGAALAAGGPAFAWEPKEPRPSRRTRSLTSAGACTRVRRRFGLRRAIGIHVEDLETGAALFSHNADRGYVPASGMKLPIMGACLHYLGPSYRFPTRLLVDAPPTEDGVIEGPVHVIGSGDPSLQRHDMDFIADSLAAFGLTEIRGDIVLDDSFPRGPGNRSGAREAPDPIQGAHPERPRLSLEPGGSGGRPPGRASNRRSATRGMATTPFRTGWCCATRGAPTSWRSAAGTRRIRLQGRILRGGNERVARFTATEPALYFGYALKGKLMRARACR